MAKHEVNIPEEGIFIKVLGLVTGDNCYECDSGDIANSITDWEEVDGETFFQIKAWAYRKNKERCNYDDPYFGMKLFVIVKPKVIIPNCIEEIKVFIEEDEKKEKKRKSKAAQAAKTRKNNKEKKEREELEKLKEKYEN